MVETQLTVRSEQGLHGRPADLFVRTANQFECSLAIRNISAGSEAVNAKSILKVLSLGIYHGHTIQVSADGKDERKALRAITKLVKSNFRRMIKMENLNNGSLGE